MTDQWVMPPPPPAPTIPDTEGSDADRRRGDRRARHLVAAALAAGVIAELGIRGGFSNAVTALAIVAVLVVVARYGSVTRLEPRLLLLAALVPTAFLAVRASPWLGATNVVLIGALAFAAVLHNRAGSVFDTSPGRLAVRGLLSSVEGMMGLGVIGRAAPRLSGGTAERAGRVATALLIAVPVLGVLVALLASADAVFASFFQVDISLGPLTGHVLLTVLAALAIVGLVAMAGSTTDDQPFPGGFGVIEVTTMLGLTAVVLGLFVTSQLVALTDAGDRLVAEAGLTPAEYARGGFFQLCWATVLLLGFVGLVRALAQPEVRTARSVRVLGGLVPLLALGLVAVSLRRMALYDQAFGLTMLRIWVVGAVLWMGAILVMTAARNVGIGSGRSWVTGGALVTFGVLVVGANVANPEAFLVRHNVERARSGAEIDLAEPSRDMYGSAELDATYLGDLSDDAAAAIREASATEIDDARRFELDRALCLSGDDSGGARGLNLARAEGRDIRSDVCEP